MVINWFSSINLISALKANLFWFLLLLPGYSLLAYLRSKVPGEKTSYFLRDAVFSFFLSLIFFLPIVIMPFFMVVPAVIPAGYFICLITVSVFFLVKNNWLLIKALNFHSFSRSLRRFFSSPICIIILIIIIFEITQGLIIKNVLNPGENTDAWFHVAKINKDVSDGFSIYDPYYLVNGRHMISFNYASNLVHVLMATGSKAFGIKPLDTWLYSVTFVRLLLFATVYVFFREIAKTKHVALFALGIFYIFAMPFYKVDNMFYSVFPYFFSVLISLFMLMLALDLKDRKYLGLKANYIAYVLTIPILAAAHQLQVVLFGIFLGGYFLFLLLQKKLQFKKFMYLIIPFLLGLPCVLFTFFSTPRLVSGRELHSVSNIANNLHAYLADLNAKLPMIILGFIILVPGIWLLSRYVRSKEIRTFLYYTVIFRYIFLFSPIVVILGTVLPWWGIARFDYFYNIIMVFVISLTSLFISQFFLQLLQGYPRFIRAYASVLLIVIVFAIYPLPSISSAEQFVEEYTKSQNLAAQIASLDIKQHSVVLASHDTGYMLPSMLDVNIVGLSDGRTDISGRENDFNALLKKTNTQKEKEKILDKYNVSYVVFDRKKAFGGLSETAVRDLGFHKMMMTQDFLLYHRD